MKNRWWAAIFAAVIALCAAALWLWPRGGETVNIYQDGELLYSIDLDRLREDTVVTLRYEAGETLVNVGPGGVYIFSADCPNQDCVRHGPLTKNGLPIVCLPERIVIRWAEGEGGVDAVDAVSG